MYILNFKDWSINEAESIYDTYTIDGRTKYIYRVSSSNKWQYQKVDTKNNNIWNWVSNLDSVKALNSKYSKTLLVHVDIKSTELDISKIDIVKAIVKAGKSLGWTENAISALVGNVGRENNFVWKYIIGTHSDPKNSSTNFGIISWQGSRLDNVKAALKKNGMLLDNGSAKEDTESIKIMINFINSELDLERGDSSLMTKSGASTIEISDMLRKYIRYSMSQPYNTPDSKFNVTKNHYWAAASKLAGLINYT